MNHDLIRLVQICEGPTRHFSQTAGALVRWGEGSLTLGNIIMRRPSVRFKDDSARMHSTSLEIANQHARNSSNISWDRSENDSISSAMPRGNEVNFSIALSALYEFSLCDIESKMTNMLAKAMRPGSVLVPFRNLTGIVVSVLSLLSAVSDLNVPTGWK